MKSESNESKDSKSKDSKGSNGKHHKITNQKKVMKKITGKDSGCSPYGGK